MCVRIIVVHVFLLRQTCRDKGSVFGNVRINSSLTRKLVKCLKKMKTFFYDSSYWIRASVRVFGPFEVGGLKRLFFWLQKTLPQLWMKKKGNQKKRTEGEKWPVNTEQRKYGWLNTKRKARERKKKQKTAAQFARWEIKALNYEHHHCFGFNSLLT